MSCQQSERLISSRISEDILSAASYSRKTLSILLPPMVTRSIRTCEDRATVTDERTCADHRRSWVYWLISDGIPTIALRFFIVFGPRQVLSNLDTSVLAIFTSRLLRLLGLEEAVQPDVVHLNSYVHVACLAARSRACGLGLVGQSPCISGAYRWPPGS
jgi:hypothetical protein